MSDPRSIQSVYVRGRVNQGPNVQGLYFLHSPNAERGSGLYPWWPNAHGSTSLAFPPDLLIVIRPGKLGECQFDGEVPHGSIVYVRCAVIEGPTADAVYLLRAVDEAGRQTGEPFAAFGRQLVFIIKGNDGGKPERAAGRRKKAKASEGGAVDRGSEGSE